MDALLPASDEVDPARAAGLLAEWGFLATPDLPDRPGPARLLVALRDRPTLRHYDPERIEYWVSVGGRGTRRSLSWDSPMPLQASFSWGPIRIVDRLGISNESLTFGGDLIADRVDGTVVAVFTSPAPLLRRGGHSQGWDRGAQSLGAFFGRFLLAVDCTPGFEARAAAASPVARYAAFLADLAARYRRSATLRSAHPDLWTLLRAEEGRLRTEHPAAWREGLELLPSPTS